MEELKIYDITESAYQFYCKFVKGNKNTDRELACKKLSRNINLALKRSKGNGRTRYYYGNMTIDVVDDVIVHIMNTHRQGYLDWSKHDKKFNKLNKRLDIPMEV